MKRLPFEVVKYRHILWLLLVIGVVFAVPTVGQGWPTNHLDSSKTGQKPYCISCHSYSSGYVTLEKINGLVPTGANVSTNRNAAFTLSFRTTGLGYGRFTVAGAVMVPDTQKWQLSATPGGDVPWAIAEQSTVWGAPLNSPYVWCTAFSENNNPNAQKGVTLDDGTAPPAPFVDRNRIAHDEEFSVKVFVDESVPYGKYTLKLWGIGTASNGVLAYNEKTVTVNVYNDTTPPTAPGVPSFSEVSTSAATLDWTASGDAETGINGYEIYRGLSSDGPFEYVAFSRTNSYTDRELLAGTSYYYKINAVDNAGNTCWGTGVGSVTTDTGARTDLAAPAVPDGLSATLVTVPEDVYKRTVKLIWNANSEADITGYYVYRATSASGNYAALNDLPVNFTESHLLDADHNIVMRTVYFIDNTVRYGTTYYYRVMAVDAAGKVSELTSYVSSTPVVDVGGADPHGNYKSKNGMCQNCHSMHSSDGKELIYFSNVTNSCYTCHDGSQSKFNTRAAFDPAYNPSHHKVPEERYSCDECHNPHYDAATHPRLLAARSKEDGQIKRSGNDFCYACHGVNSDLQNPYGRDHHTPFEASKHNSLSPSSQATGIVCRNCHVPHGSRDYPLLVSANSENFCISCHKNVGFVQARVLRDDGTVLAGVYVGNYSNDYPGTQHHENFYGRNTCTMCHEPHGSLNNRYMLIYPFNDKWQTTTVGNWIYGPVDYSNNAEEDMLCFRCHDSRYYVGEGGDYRKIVVGSKFGNGNARNYHDHTAKLKVSCRACHDPHSGKSIFHDDSKPAGFEWNLNNDLYVNFDWAKQVGIATYSSYNNRLAFIPKYDANFFIYNFSCAITCHGSDHYIGGGKFRNYSRTTNAPPVKCNGCHDFDVFDKNSRHPVLGPISDSGYTVTCEQCHIEDHTQHNKTNPYGLKDTIVTNWVYNGEVRNITTTLPKTYDPVTGKEIPAYREFCWQCHGDVAGRSVLGDKKTLFQQGPHNNLERPQGVSPYGPGLDAPCLTCHTHHSSSNVRLLRTVFDGVTVDAETGKGKINACLACHDGYPAPLDIASKYNAATSAGHYIKADPAKKLLCTECHDSHGSTNKMYLLDTDNKYNTGITFEKGHTEKKTRWFCLACHPLYNEPGREQVVYNTAYTVKAGEVVIRQLPATVADHVYNSGTEKDCTICHDPHRPWPPTGGEDKCYSCHSRPNGEATDIKSLMGLTSQPGTGLLSKHPISDADSVNNTCTTMCHTGHPHEIRADHLQHVPNILDPLNPELNGEDDWEKNLCISCHNSGAPKSPYTIDLAKYDLRPHNYAKVIRTYPADDSSFIGNCDKCHLPHGSNFKPMLRKPKDELCVSCHNGKETDKNGKVIPDIKTLYSNAGHFYTEFPEAKLYCDECHIPHGSSNDKFLRDSAEMAPRQKITYINSSGVAQDIRFPDNLTGAGYNTRLFCTTCHKEYVAENVYTWVYYTSETTPGGQVKLRNIPLTGKHGVTINDHRVGQTKPCTFCHNPHDREPFGNDETCFVCHGTGGYATQIQPLTGLNGVWPENTVPKASYHPIRDVNTAGTNDCLNMCHTKHVHNPRANLIKDKRPYAGDVSAPAPPAVYAIASSANQVDLKVYAPDDTDVIGYYVYRSTDNINWVRYGTVNSRVYAPAYLWFYDGGLSVNQKVYYKVSAFDRKGNISDYSPVTWAVTSLSADTTKPDIPLNVTASLPLKEEMQSTSIVLNWSPSSDNYEVRRYNIYRTASASAKDDPGAYTLVGSTGSTSFVDGSLSENTTYYYRITAVDAAGNESAKSAWVSATTGYASGTVKAGYFWYKYGNDTITMHVYRPEDTSRIPTNQFMNGGQIKVELSVPAGFFNFGAVDAAKDRKVAKLTAFSDSTPDINLLGSFKEVHTDTRDIYSWTGQVPSQGSVYQLTVHMGVYKEMLGGNPVYSKQILNKEVIFVAPTVRSMKTYSDSARTVESLTFKPGDTVYVTAPSEYPTNGYTNSAVALYAYDGTLVSNFGSLNSANFDQSTGHVNFQGTLPATGLNNDCWYYIGATGSVSWSGIKAIDVYRQILVRTPDTTAPTAPSALTVSGAGQNNLVLTWTGSTDNVRVAGYNIFVKKASDSAYVLAGTAAPDVLTYEITGLEPGTAYNCYVTAFDNSGNDSAPSNTVTQSTPAEGPDTTAPTAPRDLRLVVNSSSSISVYWKANPAAEKVSSYSVFRSENNLDYYKLGTTGSTTFNDTGLIDNTAYYYKVVAHDRAGNTSEYSVTVNKTTKSSGENSIEGALCMSCHDGVSVPPAGYTVKSKIGTAYNKSKHNVDYDIMTFKDGSIYRGNCTKCHVPHGSDYGYLLRQKGDYNLCFLCHESASESGKYSGKRDFLLSAHGPNLDGKYIYSSATPRYWPGGTGVDSSVPAQSPDAVGDCFNCHAPHGRYDPITGEYIKSSAWAGNSTNLNRLCFTCHGDDPATFFGEWHGKTVYSATYHGNPEKNAKMRLTDALGQAWGAGECTNCHDPHGTQNPDMLRYPVNVAGSNMNELCMKCHDREDVLADTGLFDGSRVYLASEHGKKAQWLSEYNVGGFVYNKTSFLPGVCLNCHNSHGKTTDDSADAAKVIPKMLVIQDGPENEICNKCHENSAVRENQPGYFGRELYDKSAHKGVWPRPGVLWPGGRYYGEANPEETRGKCINCHDPHGTAKRDWFGNIIHISGETFDEEEELCYTCHRSGVVSPIYDLKQFRDSGKLTGHMPWMTVNVHTYGEDLNSKPRHVECQDCHNVHAVESTWGITSLDERLPKALKGTWGIRITSWPTPNAPNYTKTGAGEWREKPVETDPDKYPYEIVSSDDPQFEEYMLCFKCHASYAPQSGGKRVVAFMNPKNASSHGFNPYSKNPTNFMNKALSRKVNGIPVADWLFRPGSPFNPNPDINVTGEPRRYKVTCSDCHGNSNPNGPKGPHGSNFDYLLKRDPKNIAFCTDCHYKEAYENANLTYAQYSFGYNTGHSRHGYYGLPTWQYVRKPELGGGWTTDPTQAANPAGVEYVARVNQLFGSNWCRWCHYAGQYWGDTKNVSVHGENASYPSPRNWYGTTTYTVYRGLNGYGMYFSASGDGQYDYSGCSTYNAELGLRSCGSH